MRKITILGIFVMLAIFVNAQSKRQINAKPIQVSTKSHTLKQKAGKLPDAKANKAVIWSNDFSVAADWTMVSTGNTTAKWVIGTVGCEGAYAIPTIASTTAANNFAKFDSDNYCGGNQIANLSTTNAIDLTGHTSVALVFQEQYKRWYDSTFIYVTTGNGGTQWTTAATKFRVHNMWANDDETTNPQTSSVDISSAITGNPANVRIRFQFYSPSSLGASAGCGYAWMVDDVQIVDMPANDIQSMGSYLDFAGMSFYEVTPVSQVGPIDFAGIANNFGTAAQTNITLNVDANNGAIAGATGTNNPIASLASGAHDTLHFELTPAVTDATWFGTKLWFTQNETDAEPLNNTCDSIYFGYDPIYYMRTQNLTSLITSYSFGTSAPAVTGMEYGASYHFIADGQIDAVTALIYKSVGTGTVVGKIYSMDAAGTLTLAAQTNPYTPTGAAEFPDIALQTPLAVTAGSIFVVTLQLNITVGTDTIKLGCDGSFPGDASLAGSAWLQVGGVFGWYTFGEVPIVGMVMNAPVQAGSTVSGNFTYLNTATTALPNVTVNLMSGATVVATTTTDAAGAYSFLLVPDGTYDITATSTSAWGGATATDVLKMKRHIAGLEILTDPLKLIAADPNNSAGTINATDVLKVQRRIAGLDAAFARPDWTFSITSVTVAGADVISNLSGLCIGDVNGSYIPVQ